MGYRLVIFDFDGTLADSFAWFVAIFNDVADRYRFRRIEAGDLETLRGLSGREMVRHVGASPWREESDVMGAGAVLGSPRAIRLKSSRTWEAGQRPAGSLTIITASNPSIGSSAGRRGGSPLTIL